MKSPSPIVRFFFLLFVMISLGGIGCGFKNAVLFPPEPRKSAIRDRYVVLLLIDGSRPDEVDRLVKAGRLPHFKELFYETGARFENAISVIPTVSTPAHQSFISGLFPGHHGIVNLDWFSRPLQQYIDYLKPRDIPLTNTFMFNFKQVQADSIQGDEPQLFYHYLTGYPTMAVFETASSGATRILPKHPPFLTAYRGKMEKFYEAFDLRAMKLTLDAFRELPDEQLPRFTFVSCYGMDLVGHFAGPSSARAEDLYLQHDRFLGELKSTLQARGIWDKTDLILVSDHGQHALKKMTDLPAMLTGVGLHLNKSRPEDGQVMWGDHGTGFTNLYLKSGDDWNRIPTLEELRNYPIRDGAKIDLVQAFISQPDIDFVVVPEDSERVRIYRKDAEATIERRETGGQAKFAYRSSGARDPFGYDSDPELHRWIQEGEFHDSESWLSRTHDKEFPDAVVLLSQLFDDSRVGDILLFTVKDSQFKESRLSGHGSMISEDMKILMMFHGPDIRPGTYPYARSVDLFPILLSLFGLEPRGAHDGMARNELFKDGVPALARGPRTLPGVSAEQFRKNILKKMESSEMSRLERDRSLQLLYSLDHYLNNGANKIGAKEAGAPSKKLDSQN